MGVTPTASTEELRVAYRALAQRLHPDRQGGATPAERALAERRMREINQAWEVLRDPDRRHAYDRERIAGTRDRAPSRGPATPATQIAVADDDDLVDVMAPMTGFTAGVVRHLPWVVALVVLGGIFVVSAYAGSRSSDPTPTTVPATSGNCVDVASGPVTTVVSCDGPHDLRIVTRVSETQACPDGTERRRLGTDGLLDCVVVGSS